MTLNSRRLRWLTPLTLLPLVLPVPAHAGWWVRDPKTNCSYHSHKFKEHPDVQISWTGACADGKLDGNGIFTIAFKGSPVVVYEGTMAGGAENGRGKRVFISKFAKYNGETYDGPWRDGLRHGRGLEKYSTGLLVEGEWTSDVLQQVFWAAAPGGERRAVNWVRGEPNSGEDLEKKEGLGLIEGILTLKGLGEVLERTEEPQGATTPPASGAAPPGSDGVKEGQGAGPPTPAGSLTAQRGSVKMGWS